MDGVRKNICECINEQSGLHVVEGHQSFITVHIDSNPGGSMADCQVGWGFCSEGVVAPISQAEEPVAIGRAYSDFALPIDGTTCHSQVPVSLFSHLHLEKGSVAQFTAKSTDFPPITVTSILNRNYI